MAVEQQTNQSIQTDETQTGDATGVLDNALLSHDPKTRLRALEGLAQSLNNKNIPLFMKSLTDVSPEVSQYAAQTLAALEPEILCEEMIIFLSKADLNTLAIAEPALPILKNPLESEMMSVLQNPEEADMRRTVAAYCLGRMGCTAAVQPLAEAAWSDNLELALTSLNSLAWLPDPNVITHILNLSAHPLPEVRIEALRALTGIGGQEAIAAVGQIAIERPANDTALSRLAVSELARIQDLKVVVPILIESMRKNLPVRKDAGAALRRLTGQPFQNLPSDWQDWWELHKKLLETPIERELNVEITYM